jgi:hypothetical protein
MMLAPDGAIRALPQVLRWYEDVVLVELYIGDKAPIRSHRP